MRQSTLASICSRTSERHAEPGTLPRVRGTTRILAFLGGFLVLGRTKANNLGQRVSADHQARARSVCSMESRLGDGDQAGKLNDGCNEDRFWRVHSMVCLQPCLQDTYTLFLRFTSDPTMNTNHVRVRTT